LGGVLAAGAGLWLGIQHTSWLGPLLADTGRAVVGPTAIARLEDAVYGVQERYNRAVHSEDAPRTHWQTEEPALSQPVPPCPDPQQPEARAFRQGR
jgi:hypothetical protein